jgi:large subunit ribosomal protein L32e
MKKIIQIRRRTPLFRRQEFGRWFNNRKKDDTWRKPKGHHGRVKRLGYQKGASPKVGYGTPAKFRHIHPSGFEPIVINNVKMLDAVDSKKQGIMISNVGMKKRIAIVHEAVKRKIRILNLRKPEEFLQNVKLKGVITATKTPKVSSDKKGETS